MSIDVIRDEYAIDQERPYRMTSGIGQQEAVTLWEHVVDKQEIHWFWPASHDEAGSMVHSGEPIRAGRRPSDGYGGRTMAFPTVKDGVIEIQGPWHTNTDALFKATGVDLRASHRTFGLIALRRDYDPKRGTVLRDIVYLDHKDGTVGVFDRVKAKAQELASSLGCPVFYYSQSRGGSSCGPVSPPGWDYRRLQDWCKAVQAT